MQLPITIGLHRSFFVDVLIGVFSALASAVILAFPCPGLLTAAILLLIWSLAAHAWKRHGPVFSAIRLERDGRISVTLPGGIEFFAVDLLPGANVHPWLSLLRLKTADRSIFPLILSFDSINAPDFRRLRVFLRWRARFSDLCDDGA